MRVRTLTVNAQIVVKIEMLRSKIDFAPKQSAGNALCKKEEHSGASVTTKGLFAILFSLIGSQSLAQSLNTYGNTGLIDMPSAHHMPDGEVAFTYGLVGNSSRATVSFQIAPRVEGSIRYSNIDGWSASDLDRNDRQFDFKINLLDETTAPFSLAIGARDFLGSAVYSSEYIVASKAVSDGLRFTGGIGWGRLGSSRSDVGFFGGVEWQPKGSPWRLKAEYSSDEYVEETASGQFSRNNGFNFGVERPIPVFRARHLI